MSCVSSFSYAEERRAFLHLSTSHDENSSELTSNEDCNTPKLFSVV